MKISKSKSNKKMLCFNCGREFLSSTGHNVFCSMECKRRYGNHTFYRCMDCRTLPCPHRNQMVNVTPQECPNYNWNRQENYHDMNMKQKFDIEPSTDAMYCDHHPHSKAVVRIDYTDAFGQPLHCIHLCRQCKNRMILELNEIWK